VNVRELIAALAEFGDDEPVFIDTDNHRELASEITVETQNRPPLIPGVVIVGDGENVAWL
jgi:hypothetical protein